jgi:transcriptional regulator with XRE-family HTH domain
VIDNQFKKEVGKRIQLLIQEWGLNNLSFGKLVGVDNSTVGKMAKGEKPPTLDMALELFSKKEISTDWFLFGKGEKYVQEKSGPSQEPDYLLTQIENHAQSIIISLKELKKVPHDVFQRGTNVVPGFARKANISDKKKTDKKPKDK